MNKKETTKWMNIYHDNWINAHNRLVEVQDIFDRWLDAHKKLMEIENTLTKNRIPKYEIRQTG